MSSGHGHAKASSKNSRAFDQPGFDGARHVNVEAVGCAEVANGGDPCVQRLASVTLGKPGALWERRRPRCVEFCWIAAAGDMNVAIDEAGDDVLAGAVQRRCSGCGRFGYAPVDSNDIALLERPRLRVEDESVLKDEG